MPETIIQGIKEILWEVRPWFYFSVNAVGIASIMFAWVLYGTHDLVAFIALLITCGIMMRCAVNTLFHDLGLPIHWW